MQKKIENKYLMLSFDSDINNIIELRNKITKDNYIKVLPNSPIFSLWGIKKESNIKEKLIPLAPNKFQKICDEKKQKFELYYNKFIGREVNSNINAKITIEIQDDLDEIIYNIELENHDEKYDIVEVLFPHVRGIFLGKSWKDDVIVYPQHAGEKTLNPIEEYTKDKYLKFWRAGTKMEDDIYYREINYCGLASMMWMYYYDKNNGFYFSSNDKDFTLSGIRAETGGIKNPWMGFGIRKYIKIKSGDNWKSNPYCMAVNCKDWHWGAKTYRNWFDKHIKIQDNSSYLKNECALNQCYNFKKDGKIYNRFNKIPDLFEEGKKYGMRHMFIASWNRKGFDCNYPEYYPDMELGTSMDLYNGCKYVNENGGFVTFYINSRIFDKNSDFYNTLGKSMAIKDEKQDVITEQYGPVKFAVMCPSNKMWQKHLIDTACWMVKSYGATGIYLDQLGSGEPFPCYDNAHTHDDTGKFNKGYLKIIKVLNDKLKKINPNAFLMIENCGDIYGSCVWGNLTWNAPEYDEFFNMFKYTFPEYVQINMINPRHGKCGKSRIKKFYEDIERAILLGSVLWIGPTYRFDEDDEQLKKYAKKAIMFREKINPYITNSKYLDNEGISHISEGINITRWNIDNKSELFIGGNSNELSDCYFTIETQSIPINIICEDINGKNIDIKHDFKDNYLEIQVPKSKIFYMLLNSR